MIVARSPGEIGTIAGCVVTVGTFDGVHRGHQSIIAGVRKHADAAGVKAVVVTFDPHPREVVEGRNVSLLTTLDERLAIMETLGIDAVLVLEFTFAFSRIEPREFYERNIIRGLGAGAVIVGYDHMFGRDRAWGIHELRGLGAEFGFTVEVVDPVSLHGTIISSSKIREALLAGNAEGAAEMLGRPYSITGTVVVGDRRGKSIGFPTANIAPADRRRLIPADGVYCVGGVLGGKWRIGMMNIGIRPTLTTGAVRTIEVHWPGFDGDLYGYTLKVDLLKRLRPEQRFGSVSELVEQLKKDRDDCRRFAETVPSLS